MTGWNFDISQAPRGRKETRTRTVKVNGKPQEQHYEVHIPERVLLAHPTEDKVFSSYWLEPTKFTPNGRWSGWCEGQTPRAWMAYPDHPDFPSSLPEREQA